MKQTLNEQQEAQAAKEIGAFRYPIYAASTVCSGNEKKRRFSKGLINFAYVEAERWVDARSFALRLFGVAEVKLVLKKKLLQEERWQIRWDGCNGFVTMQARYSVYDNPLNIWRDVREITG